MLLAENTKLEDLRHRINRIEQCGSEQDRLALPFAVADIDRTLPAQGFATGALHEFCAEPHPTHEAAMISFVCGILARLVGPVIWCLRHNDLFAPGLAGFGLTAARVHYVEERDERTRLLLMEEGLRHAGVAGVVGEINRLSMTASRRLHLAARTTGVTAFVLHRTPRATKAATIQPTIAETRWRISTAPSSPLPVAGIGRARWLVELLRCRNGEPGSWELEACDETGHVALPAELVHRPAAEERRLSA